MKTIILFILLITTTFLFAVNNPMSYQNALFDSDAMKYNGEYYFSGNFMAGDMLVSRDLRNWGWRTHVFSYNNSWHTSGGDNDIHAPHLRYHNGIFHYYAHLGVHTGQDGIVHATNNYSPTGTYIEPNTSSPFSQWIDSDTFKDDDGTFTFYSTEITSGEERIYSRPMSDLFNVGSRTELIDPANYWEYGNINEASKVFKYRNRYYMLYNGNLGSDAPYDYAIGCIDASNPTAFNDTPNANTSGKYTSPVLRKTIMNGGNNEISRCGQPWVVDGPNGFEKWVGYFARYDDISSGRIWLAEGNFIDRLYFNGHTLYADGPTHGGSSGYHPPPAHPEYLGLFNGSDGGLPSELTYGAGTWNIVDKELRQTDSSSFRNVIINTNKADNFLVEANIKFLNSSSTRAGIVLFKDGNDWLRVGLDDSANRWYYERNNDGSYDTANYALPAGFNFQVYHKIRLQKNGNTVDIRIDDIPAPTLSSVSINFDGAAQAELFTDDAQAAFDGVVYTIGWDEWNSRVQYWGNSKSGFPQVGTWNYVSAGINSTETNNAKYIFKGDWMEEYEIDVRCTVLNGNANSNRRLGISPAFVDSINYLLAEVDPTTTQLIVKGVTNGVGFAYSPVAITYNPTPGSWNIRAAKLKNKIIIFVNGKELLTANVTYAASQIGLITENQDANFSTILVYETKNKTLPTPWKSTDIGDVKYKGRADFTENFITINASGSDFWHTHDEGHFVYQKIDSDKEIIAKVETLDPASYWSKACVMIRENLSSNSPMAYITLSRLDANNTNSAQFIWRAITGGGTGVLAKDKYRAFPSYIKLTRIRNTFAGYWSADGENWEFIGNTEISMNQICYIGLAVSPNNRDRFNGAVFSDVKVQDIKSDAIAYWRFEEGTNDEKHTGNLDNFYLDSTTNNNHLSSWESGSRPMAINDIPFSTVPQTGSPNTLALDFNPDENLGTFGTQTGGKMIETYMFDTGWSVELSFKLNSFKWQMLLGKDGHPAGTAPPTFFIKASNPTGDKFIDIGFFDNQTNYVATSSITPLELNKWYNLALTFNGGIAKLYIKKETDANYDLENSVTSANPASLGQWAKNWAVGRGMWNGDATDFTDGKIDEIRISNAALAPEQFLGSQNTALPFVNITNNNAEVAYVTSQYTIGGTNNTSVVGTMSWDNNGTGLNGTFAAATVWTVPNIGINVGTNIITVSCTNIYGAVSSDNVTITRQMPEPVIPGLIGLLFIVCFRKIKKI